LVSPKRTLVGHGIDLAHFAGDPNHLSKRSGPLKFVTACRLSPVKRVELLLEAFKKFEGDWSLDIAGDAPMEEQKKYERKLKEMADGLGGRVKWLGAVPYTAMPEFLSKGDVLVNLSETGSLDKNVLEAVASGLTVLTSNEAFKSFLEGTEHRSYLNENDAAVLRERLEELLRTSRFMLQADQKILYQRLVERHSLPRLAKILVSRMKEIVDCSRNTSS